jgi:hypothetical protein
MSHRRLRYTRAAWARLQRLPLELRLHVETHLENLAQLVEATSPERLALVLTRDEEGFVTGVRGVQVHFALNAVARTLLVHRLAQEPAYDWEPEANPAGHE